VATLRKAFFIPETINLDHDHHYISMYYIEYKYYKDGDKMQKPERCY